MALPPSLELRSAQSGVIDVRPFRKAEEALFHKFGLKPRVTLGDKQAVGIGGRAKVLGKVEMPSGMGGVNGIVKYTVVDSPGVPPLTPVSLLKQVGAVIDLNSHTMDLKKIETTTTLRTLPSGHVAHKLTKFARGGWKASTPEQTDLFQVKTDEFRPVTLPGEIKSMSSKRCVGLSRGFVYTIRDRSYPTPSHHQHDPDLCIDDAMSSELLLDDQLAQRTSGFECPIASGFDVNANSAMGKLCTGRRGSVAKTCLRCLVRVTRASWQIVLDSCNQDSSRIAQTECTHLPELLVHRADRWASMDVCDRKRGGCGAIMNYVHSAASIAHKEAKARMKGTKKEVTTISQRAGQIVEHAHTRKKTLHVQDATANFMSSTPLRDDSTLSWMDSRRNTVYADQSIPQWGRRPWRVAEYQPYRRWRFSEWFWWPRNTPKTRRWRTESTSYKRLDGPGASFGGKPSLGTGTIRLMATSFQQYQHLQYQQQLVTASTTDPWRVLSEDGGSTGDRWSMDTGTDRIGV